MGHTSKIICSTIAAVFLAFTVVWLLIAFVPIKEHSQNSLQKHDGS